MKMIKAIVRPEKVASILYRLSEKGFNSVTHASMLGRGKQRGLKVGDVYYDELPKDMLIIVVEDNDVDAVIAAISKAAKSDNGGAYGDGKIFVSTVDRVFTVSSGEEVL